MEKEKNYWRILLLSPPLIIFSIFVIWPLFSSFYYAFTNWNGFNSNYDYVGFKNFLKIWSDPLFFGAIINTIIWIVVAIILPTFLGLILALLIDTSIKGAVVFKTVFYMPICLSAVVVGQIWIWIFQNLEHIFFRNHFSPRKKNCFFDDFFKKCSLHISASI